MQTIRRSWHRLPLAARRAMPCVAILIAASAALAQPYVYVANLGSDDISVLDTGTGSVVKTLPGGDDPNGVAVSSDGRQAFVTNFAGGTLSIIDTASNTIGMAVPVGNGPVGVAIATDGRTAYVANRGDDTVAVVDTTSGAVLAAVPVGDGPNAVAIAPDGRTAYVTNSFAKFPGAVSVLDLASRTVRDTVVVDRVPNRVAVSRDGTRAYVSHFRDWNLSVIDTATDAVIETLRISRQPSSVAVSPNGAYVYVTGRGYADETDGNVQIVETATDRVTGSLLAGLDPRAIAINRRGDVGYSADFGNNTVTALDLADEAVLGEIPVGDRPFALAVNCIGSECTAPAYTPKPTKTVTSTPTVPTPTATATFTPTATITTTPTRTATLRPGLEHVVIEISGAQAAPGGRVPIEVVLHTGGQVVYGVTHDIDFNNFVGVVARAPGVPACALDASVDGSAAFEFLPSPFNPSCSVDCAGLHVAIEASTPLLDGAVLYRCAIQVASFAPIGTQRLTNDGVGASGPHGEVLATRGLDGIISVVSGPTPPPEVLLRLSDIRGRPGERVTLEVHLDTHGHAVAGTQNDIEFAPYIGIAASRDGSPDCTVNPAIGKAATAFAFEPPGCSGSACTALRALVLSLVDTDPIADGALLYTCQIDIPPDVEPGTFAFRSSNLDASTPDGGAIPTGATGGSITVLGTSFHQQTTAEPPCTDASCITVEGICDGGDDDGLLCDCPGGTCVRQPACSSDPERGTCRGGARDAQCCDRSLNCGGGAACAGTTLVCGSGPSKGIPCLDDHQCIGAACVEGNGRCNAGAFRGSTCIDDRDCPLGACVKLDSSGPRIMPGFPCTRDEDCETGVCDTFDLICCNRACNADERCSGDGTCVAFDFTPSPATPTASQPQTPTSTRLPTLPTANPCGACPNGTDCNKGDPPLCVETRSGGGCSIAANPATDDLAVAALLPVALWLTRCWQLRLRRTRMRRRRPHP